MNSPTRVKNTKYSPTRIVSSISRRLVEVVKGPSAHFETRVYIESRAHQLGVLFGGVSPESFRGKMVLEVGCGHGHLGAELEKLGAQVTSTDARPGNIQQLRKKFPTGKPLSAMRVHQRWKTWEPMMSSLRSVSCTICPAHPNSWLHVRG